MRSDDPAHSRALAESKINRTIVTTEFVLLELGNACARSVDHEDFFELLDAMRASARVKVIPADSHLLNRGLELMAARPDKDWPLTDCISFIVMEDEGLKVALTSDRHFEQAGFVALLK